MSAAYVLKHVIYGYDGPPVLQIEDLEIPEGKIVGLVGPNGSGKTTLLNILSFVEVPGRGTITFFGEEFQKGKLLAFRRKVGFLLQNPYLFHDSVMANLTWAMRLRGISSAHARREALKALDKVGLSGFENRQARSLSGGESQRVALARALVLNPDALLLDEPSNHMDKASWERTEQIVLELNRDFGKTIIMATHGVDVAQTLAHTMIHLRQGKVAPPQTDNVFNGEPDDNGLVFDTGKIRIELEGPATGATCVIIDPNRTHISLDAPENYAKNAFSAKVLAMSAENGKVRVEVDAGERLRIFISRDSALLSQLRLGAAVWVVLEEGAVTAI
jgi:tungstate transport system ATP-binding protein